MTHIANIEDFEVYCRSKNVIPFVTLEIPNDGYYAEIHTGEANVKDFTQVGLRAPKTSLVPKPCTSDIFPERYEWVRVGFADCDNELILNS